MAEPLKHQMDASLVRDLRDRFAAVEPAFDATGFERRVLDRLDDRELKARVDLIADELRVALPLPYPEALRAVVAVASRLDGFAAWPLCSFVERHGLEHPHESLTAMETLTRHMSCEFAIRPFLDRHLDLTLAHLRRWTTHPDERVRRLPSEGTRPHLPWAPSVDVLIADPSIGLDLIERLRHDPSTTVRRSVANHLNDVARRHPDRVVEIVTRWQAEDPTVDGAMVRQALRSLIKKGHPGAMAALGFSTDPQIEVIGFAVEPASIHLGESIHLRTEIRSTGARTQRLVVDFVVHHRTRSSATIPKVFKWTSIDLEPGEQRSLTKRRLIQTASTRRYRAGRHRVDLQVGGVVVASSGFELRDDSPT